MCMRTMIYMFLIILALKDQGLSKRYKSLLSYIPEILFFTASLEADSHQSSKKAQCIMFNKTQTSKTNWKAI